MGVENIPTTPGIAQGDCKDEKCKYADYGCNDSARGKLCADYQEKGKPMPKDEPEKKPKIRQWLTGNRDIGDGEDD